MSEENHEQIDLDDPSLRESGTYDPDQNIDERIPPPEIDTQGNAIEYMIKLSVGENPKGEKSFYAMRTKESNKPYVALKIKAQIVDPGQPWDNAFVQYPFGGVSTIQVNNTTSMADLCRRLGSKMPTGLSHIEQAEFMMQQLANDPILPGRIQWTGYCTGCKENKPKLSGERNWPEKLDGENVIGHISVLECEDCDTDIVASPKIKKLFEAR